MKLLLASFVLVLSLAASAACPKPELVFGYDPYPPFQKNENGKPGGIDIDISTAVLEKMGCKIKFSEMPWKRVMSEIEGGTADMTGSANKTPEREKFAHFAPESYLKSRTLFFVAKGDEKKYPIKKMEDLLNYPGFKLGIIRGYEYGGGYDVLAKNPKFTAMFDESGDEEQNLKKLALKRVNGLFMEEFPALENMKNYGLVGQIVPTDFVVSDQENFFMFSKKSLTEAFVKEYSDTLKKMKGDGSLKKILAKYSF